MKRCIVLLFIIVLQWNQAAMAQNPVYAGHLNELIRLYSSGQLKKACTYADTILQKIKIAKSKKDTIYPYILYYSSIVHGLQKNFDRCARLVPELEEICLKRYGKKDIKYWSALDFQRLLMHANSNAEKRLKYQQKAIPILLDIYGSIGPGVVKSFDLSYTKKDIQFYIQSTYTGLGTTYANLNDHKSAIEAYREAERFFDEDYVLSLDPQSFLSSKSTYGSYLLMVEELEESEKVFAGLEFWVRKNFTPSHPVYGEMLYRLGNYFYTIGQLAKSEKYLAEAKQILENTFQKNSSEYTFTIFRLCDIYFSGYRPEKMDGFINELRKVSARIDTSYRISYVLNKIYLIEYYEKINNGKSVDSLITLLDEVFKNKDFSYSYVYNNYLAVKTSQFEKQHSYQAADSLYRIRLRYRENLGVSNTKAYATLLLNRSINLFNWGKSDEAMADLKKSIHTITSNLEKTFSFLSESEKQSYISTTTSIFNQLNSMAWHKKEADLVKLAYNCQLILKELLIKTSILVNKPHADNDSAYNKSFEAYFALRKKMIYQASLPEGQKNNQEGLLKEAEKLEKRLAKSSTGFIKNQFRPIRVEELQNALEPKTAAVEFTHFHSGDSVFYMALVTKYGISNPILVPLFEKKQLDGFLLETAKGRSEEMINSRFAGNTTLYRMIWEPVVSNLQGVSKIYFSLSGDLFRIPVTILPVRDSQKICDLFQLTQLNSTSSIVNPRNYTIENDDQLFLYGGIFYDGDSTELINAAARYNLADFATRSLPENMMRGEFWQYLPNTKTEVESVYEKAGASNLKASLFTGWQATEESVKSFDGQRSPAVLHFATHGFFYPDPLQKKTKNRYTVGTAFTNSDDPLMRSGICLAGANYAWDNKPLKGIQDGVLTAYEISNLDLSHTKLVVLSACETALGDIVEYEGVFGLQRAFKIAGVQTLVMSLWSVPDNITADFMIELYRELFEKKNMEEAFRNAQTIFRKKFPAEPYKWGAWILVK